MAIHEHPGATSCVRNGSSGVCARSREDKSAPVRDLRLGWCLGGDDCVGDRECEWEGAGGVSEGKEGAMRLRKE